MVTTEIWGKTRKIQIQSVKFAVPNVLEARLVLDPGRNLLPEFHQQRAQPKLNTIGIFLIQRFELRNLTISPGGQDKANSQKTQRKKENKNSAAREDVEQTKIVMITKPYDSKNSYYCNKRKFCYIGNERHHTAEDD